MPRVRVRPAAVHPRPAGRARDVIPELPEVLGLADRLVAILERLAEADVSKRWMTEADVAGRVQLPRPGVAAGLWKLHEHGLVERAWRDENVWAVSSQGRLQLKAIAHAARLAQYARPQTP